MSFSKTGFSGRKVLVMGAARSGLGAAELLLNSGALVTLTDLKPEEKLGDGLSRVKEHKNLTLHLGRHIPVDFTENEIIVISPGVPSDHELIKNAKIYGSKVISEIELAYHFFTGKIIGITGTNGKTTSTTLTGEIFKGAEGITSAVSGNIGFPITSAVLENPKLDYMITEISSFQLENIFDFKVIAGTVLNIDPDHMDRYKTVEEYAETKARIFNSQDENDWIVLNLDDRFHETFKASTPANIIPFSTLRKLDSGIWIEADKININIPKLGINDNDFIRLSNLKLKGRHNHENIIPAIAFGLIAGISKEKIVKTITEFTGLPHRIEFSGKINTVEFYNDSKATNVSAVLRALEMFNGRKLVLILGGSDKNLDFSPLLDPVRNSVAHLILIGETAPKLEKVFSGKIAYSKADSMDEAVEKGYNFIKNDGVVLLSPACASFDWFSNYKERGEVFKKAVQNLRKKVGNEG
ncbi:MAG: UDP-N-acetylmuramoyl-L-alanine--D-glutamate ligase [bacterium]|nr:UDP-N-acetylmuramoyl-L-alanine--D-glutamate ligase [bacterium]